MIYMVSLWRPLIHMQASDILSSTWAHPQRVAEMLSRKFYRMTFKTFGRVDLHTGEILSTRNTLRGSNAVTYICDGSKCRNVASICVSTSGGQRVSYINCSLTIVLSTQVLYLLGRHVSKYMLQCF
jgi:hypothetical protein